MKPYYNLDEAAKILGVKVRTLRGWIKEGRVVSFKIANGRRKFITREELLIVTGGRANV